MFFQTVEREIDGPTETIDELIGGSERILLVDDEEPLARLGHRMLERLGYEVVSKTSPTGALETFRQSPKQFDLVVTDMTMPHMTGEMLAKEIMRIRPDIPVVLSTGFSHRIDDTKARTAGIRAFVMKPITTHDLAKTVRRVLDTR